MTTIAELDAVTRARLLDPEQTPGVRIPAPLRHGQTAELVGDDIVRVEGQCLVTRKLHRALYPMLGLLAWSLNGAAIQAALPDTSLEDREFLQTSTSPEGWRKMFGDEAEDEDCGHELDDDGRCRLCDGALSDDEDLAEIRADRDAFTAAIDGAIDDADARELEAGRAVEDEWHEDDLDGDEDGD